jgi:hypothetical protein
MQTAIVFKTTIPVMPRIADPLSAEGKAQREADILAAFADLPDEPEGAEGEDADPSAALA